MVAAIKRQSTDAILREVQELEFLSRQLQAPLTESPRLGSADFQQKSFDWAISQLMTISSVYTTIGETGIATKLQNQVAELQLSKLARQQAA